MLMFLLSMRFRPFPRPIFSGGSSDPLHVHCSQSIPSLRMVIAWDLRGSHLTSVFAGVTLPLFFLSWAHWKKPPPSFVETSPFCDSKWNISFTWSPVNHLTIVESPPLGQWTPILHLSSMLSWFHAPQVFPPFLWVLIFILYLWSGSHPFRDYNNIS